MGDEVYRQRYLVKRRKKSSQYLHFITIQMYSDEKGRFLHLQRTFVTIFFYLFGRSNIRKLTFQIEFTVLKEKRSFEHKKKNYTPTNCGFTVRLNRMLYN